MPIVLSDYSMRHVSHWIERKHTEFKENQKVLPKYEWLLHKFEAAIADASWRRDIHRANNALMQNHLRRVGSGPPTIEKPSNK